MLEHKGGGVHTRYCFAERHCYVRGNVDIRGVLRRRLRRNGWWCRITWRGSRRACPEDELIDEDGGVEAADNHPHLGIRGAGRGYETGGGETPAGSGGGVGFDGAGADGGVAGIAPSNLQLEAEGVGVRVLDIHAAGKAVGSARRQIGDCLADGVAQVVGGEVLAGIAAGVLQLAAARELAVAAPAVRSPIVVRVRLEAWIREPINSRYQRELIDEDDGVEATGDHPHLGVRGAGRGYETGGGETPAGSGGGVGFDGAGADGGVAGIAPSNLQLEAEGVGVRVLDIHAAGKAVGSARRQIGDCLADGVAQVVGGEVLAGIAAGVLQLAAARELAVAAPAVRSPIVVRVRLEARIREHVIHDLSVDCGGEWCPSSVELGVPNCTIISDATL